MEPVGADAPSVIQRASVDPERHGCRDLSFDSYRVGSPSGALNFADWNSLSDQNVTPFDGPDGGTTPGDGIGETWDEAGGSNDNVLAESFLLSSTTIAINDSLPLGMAFKPAGLHDITFEYRDPATQAVVVGTVEYAMAPGVFGDYNNDGKVDAADYVVFRNAEGTSNVLPNDSFGGVIGPNQYNQWKAHFGQSAGSGLGSEVGRRARACRGDAARDRCVSGFHPPAGCGEVAVKMRTALRPVCA